jgi:hypothetical protein
MSRPVSRPSPVIAKELSASSMLADLVILIQDQTTAAIASLIENALFRPSRSPAPDEVQERMAGIISKALHYAHGLSRAPGHDLDHAFVQRETKALMGEFELRKLIAQWTFTRGMNNHQKRGVKESVERAIKRVMQADRQPVTTTALAQSITPTTSSPAETPHKLQELQRLVKQLIIPALKDQCASLEQLRVVLETTSLHWEKNDHNMDALDKVQENLRAELLLRSLKVIVLYRRMMRTVEELRKMEVMDKGMIEKERMSMIELDRAVDILEGLALD